MFLPFSVSKADHKPCWLLGLLTVTAKGLTKRLAKRGSPPLGNCFWLTTPVCCPHSTFLLPFENFSWNLVDQWHFQTKILKCKKTCIMWHKEMLWEWYTAKILFVVVFMENYLIGKQWAVQNQVFKFTVIKYNLCLEAGRSVTVTALEHIKCDLILILYREYQQTQFSAAVCKSCSQFQAP